MNKDLVLLEPSQLSEQSWLIFLDINMPLLNGDPTLVEIRKDQRLKDTKVVMHSTTVNQNSNPVHANLNAQYDNKPHTVKEGIRVLRHFIQGSLA